MSDCAKMCQDVSAGNGNTKSIPARDNACRYWSFTWNNHDLEEFETILCQKFKNFCDRWVCQEEIGKNGTPHIQGTFKLKGRGLRFSQLKKMFPCWHLEKTRNIEASFQYCQKDDTSSGKLWIFPEPEKPLKCIEELKPWMKEIEGMCREEPDFRTINWLCDKKGNVGKSQFARYMFIKNSSIICTGGAAKDIANLVKNIIEGGRSLRNLSVFIFDIPRCVEGKISYRALEEIKNGMVTNCKYETGTFVFNPPHVWVFSNEWPDVGKMSEDRWKLWTIIDDKLMNEPLSKAEDLDWMGD